MKTELINIGDRDFFRIELEKIRQGKYSFFIAKIPFKYLEHIYTVKPLNYDMKLYKSYADKYSEDADYYKDLIDRININKLPDEFQRLENSAKLNSIARYVTDEKYPLFPNSIIATCDLANTVYQDDGSILVDENSLDTVKNVIELEGSDSPRSVLSNENGHYILYTPNCADSLIVIDGQHRIKGLQKAGSSINEKYDLLISFLIGYGRSLVANQFYTINYTQKPVNKSILYQLMGQFSTDLNTKTYLHGIVRMLNEVDKSALFNRIKMLGVKPKSYSDKEKDLMTVSQAFVIDYLAPTLGKRITRSDYQPVFRYYYDNEMKMDVAKFIFEYINAIKIKFHAAWSTPSDNIVSKSLSLGAFMKLLQLFYVRLFISESGKDPNFIKGYTAQDMQKLFDGLEPSFFNAATSEFAQGTSAGNLGRLKNKILEQLDYFPGNDFESKISEFRKNDLKKYKEWFSSNVA